MRSIKRDFEVEGCRRASPAHRPVPLPKRGENCSLLFASREFIGLQMGAQLRRYDGGWRLMQAHRVTAYAGQAEHSKIVIQRKEYEAIKARAVAGFEVAQ